MANAGWTPESNDNVQQCADVALGVNEDGRLEIYTYSTVGEFNICHKWQEWDAQKQNIIGFSNWDIFPASKDRTYFNNADVGNRDIFIGLTANGDSCEQVLTQGAWGIAQKSKNGTWPDHISRLGAGPSDRTMMSAMARSSTGVLHAFGVDQGSFDIHFARQAKAGAAWSWHTIKHPPNVGAFAVRVDDWNFRSHIARIASHTVGVGGNFDGRIEFFYGSAIDLWSISETAPGTDNWQNVSLNNFPGYTNLADWTVIQNDPRLVEGDNAGRLEVFALGLTAAGTYTLFHSWQLKSNGSTGWSAWEAIPGLGISLLPTQDLGHSFLKGPIRAARQEDGSIVIFAIGVDPLKDPRSQNRTSLFYIQQNGPGASFRRNWVNLGGDNISAFDIGQNLDGTLMAVICSPFNSDPTIPNSPQIWRRQQVEINKDEWTTA